MRIEDLYKDTSNDPITVRDSVLDQDLTLRISCDTIPDFTDIEIAEAICTLARNELIACANGLKQTLTDSEFRTLARAGMATSRRLGIEFPRLPFRDFTSFQSWWKAEGMTDSGSWQLRRGWVQEAFQPYDLQITELILTMPDTTLIDPVPTATNASWDTIETEITHLRHRYTQAQRPDELCSVGLACVRITEILAELVFDEHTHLIPSEEPPHKGATINRFTYVIDHELKGPGNAEMRKIVRSVIPLTQSLKHATNPTKKVAALACDSTIVLVNMMRNIVNPDLA